MQDTEELTLPVTGKKVMIKGYVSGLIAGEVKELEAGANQISYEIDPSEVNKDNPEDAPKEAKMILKSDPTAKLKSEKLLLEKMVIAIDGETNDAFNRLLNLPARDVQAVSNRVNELFRDGEVEADDPKAPTISVQS